MEDFCRDSNKFMPRQAVDQTNMEKKIVVALMGAGRAGREHATNLGSLSDVRVALVCDPITAAAQNAGELARADKITESVDEVICWGSVRFCEYAVEVGDVDTATTLLEFKNGAQGVVQNCRRAAYGYDVMTEVSGEHGKFVVQAESKTPISHFRKGGWERDYYHFFMDRFGAAFRGELVAFFEALSREQALSPDSNDALESLRIGVAATRSLREGRPVKLAEVGAERLRES
jgi:predicted dehydrogenase